MLEESVLQEHIRQQMVIFWLGLAWGGVMSAFVWKRGFFGNFVPSFLPKIKGLQVLEGFTAFLLAELLIMPALIVVVGYLLTGKILSTAMLGAETKGWLNILIVLGGFTGVWIAYLRLPSATRTQLWHQTSLPWYKQVMMGIATWFVSYPLVVALSQLVSIAILLLYRQPSLDQVAVKHMKNILADPLIFGVTSIEVICLVPITEELLFRGFLQSWLKSKLNHIPGAIILTSLIFSIFHYSSSQGVTNIELLSSLFMLSCILGFIYEKQRSLWAPIGMHAFFNMMSIIFILKS